MIAGSGDGIDLDTPFHWSIEGLKQPGIFFEHLPESLPADAILYMEGVTIAPEVAAFYLSHRAADAGAVARDTLLPVPDIYHCTFSPRVCAALQQLAENHPVAQLFDHIKAYRGQELLFTFHDAFDGYLLVSEHVAEDALARFCRALGVSRRRKKTRRRDPEQIRRFLAAMENPGELRIVGPSRWKRLWRWWAG